MGTRKALLVLGRSSVCRSALVGVSGFLRVGFFVALLLDGAVFLSALRGVSGLSVVVASVVNAPKSIPYAGVGVLGGIVSPVSEKSAGLVVKSFADVGVYGGLGRSAGISKTSLALRSLAP